MDRSRQLLRALGRGQSIAPLTVELGWTRAEFDRWWEGETRRRLATYDGSRRLPVRSRVEILRDRWGVPHVFADSDEDLFVAYGYAMAQDRLFQLDHQRRRGHGRLAEVLGPAFLEQDVLARTIGLNRIARAELAGYPDEVRSLLDAFARGVNVVIEDGRDGLPIEFDLLGYAPEPWSALDSAASTGMWRWQLTGRPHVIAGPELLKRELGDGPLYRAFLDSAREHDEVSIIPPGSMRYAPVRPGALEIGAPANGPDDGNGSNNWVVAGARTASGRPLVASDPHMPYAAQSSFFEVHLAGGRFNVAGAGFVGMPGIVFGRNDRVAWSVTNNICSLRDLYQEREDPGHPGCFLYDGTWEPARELVEEIAVAGSEAHRLVVRLSRNGPIVDALLPPLAQSTGPVSMRWVGEAYCDWQPALLRSNRATSAEAYRTAIRGWSAPTFNLLFADIDGHIGYQASGAIPIREIPERGYRPGWDPAHAWAGLIPPEGMPQVDDPTRGWLASANNRPAPEGFPYPLSGTWDDAYRAARISSLLEQADRLDVADVGRMHTDFHVGRAEDRLPRILELLGDGVDAREQAALALLRGWDLRSGPDSVGASLFNVFFSRWTQAVAAVRISADRFEFLAAWLTGLAAELLEGDPAGWFPPGADRVSTLRAAFTETLDELERWCGPDLATWRWGRVHPLTLRHVLSGRGDLGDLLDHRRMEVGGTSYTVSNSNYVGSRVAIDAVEYRSFESVGGAGYRVVSDLGSDPPAAWAVTLEGQSGQAGSEHVADQEAEFVAGRYHEVPLTRVGAERVATSRLELLPVD